MPNQSTGKDVIWHPYTSLKAKPAIVIKKAKGVYLYPEKGEPIIDGISSWWVNVHGHGRKWQAKALATQCKRLDHIIFAGFKHKPAQVLAHKILRLLPEQKKVFYSDNGSTAIEVALKMAVQFFYNQGIEKNTIIALKGGYHGDTFGAMAAAERSVFTKPFDSMLFNVEFLDLPNENNYEEVLAHFNQICQTKQVAAFIFEPLIQGAGGMRIYEAKYLDKLLKAAQSQNIIAIADEVMTGFYRTGTLFACDQLTYKPDIYCMSKALSGGILPLAITTCNEKIVTAFDVADKEKTFYHGHSYTANAISCNLAVESLKRLQRKKMRERIKKLVKWQRVFAKEIAKHPSVASAKSLGTILSIELKSAQQTGYLNQIRDSLYEFFLARQILLRPLGNVIYFMPPYVIKKKQAQKVYSAIRLALDKL